MKMKMKMKTGQMVKDHGSRKISPPVRERTHCPQKYMGTMSSTQGQCVHMKKKRIMMIPMSVLMWQKHEKNPPMLKKSKIACCTSAGSSSTMFLFFCFIRRFIFLILFRFNRPVFPVYILSLFVI